jgi:hypothetical protein
VPFNGSVLRSGDILAISTNVDTNNDSGRRDEDYFSAQTSITVKNITTDRSLLHLSSTETDRPAAPSGRRTKKGRRAIRGFSRVPEPVRPESACPEIGRPAGQGPAGRGTATRRGRPAPNGEAISGSATRLRCPFRRCGCAPRA